MNLGQVHTRTTDDTKKHGQKYKKEKKKKQLNSFCFFSTVAVAFSNLTQYSCMKFCTLTRYQLLLLLLVIFSYIYMHKYVHGLCMYVCIIAVAWPVFILFVILWKLYSNCVNRIKIYEITKISNRIHNE